jgi:hypothetical protein
LIIVEIMPLQAFFNLIRDMGREEMEWDNFPSRAELQETTIQGSDRLASNTLTFINTHSSFDTNFLPVSDAAVRFHQ